MFSVDHLAIAVKDLDTATRFYQDVLGLSLPPNSVLRLACHE